MSLNDTQGKDVTRRLQHKRGRRSREEMRQLQLEREELETVSFPVCTAHPDCHAWKGGRCMALTDTDFGTRDCPFYKNKDQNEWEQQDALERLIDQGRLDLIEKYKTPLVKLGILPDTDGIVRGSSDLEDPYIDQIAAELEQYSEQYVQELLETGETGASRKSGNDCSDTEEGWDD